MIDISRSSGNKSTALDQMARHSLERYRTYPMSQVRLLSSSNSLPGSDSYADN